jgi:alkyldihydroxyacetonephosphate synthase
VKGFVPTELSVATLLFEGTKEEVARQQKVVFEVAAKHKGISGGEGLLPLIHAEMFPPYCGQC